MKEKGIVAILLTATLIFLIFQIEVLLLGSGLLQIPWVTQDNMALWSFGAVSGAMLVLSCMAVMNYGKKDKAEDKKIERIVDELKDVPTKNIVKVKRYKNK
jgi:hypothetical protein